MLISVVFIVSKILLVECAPKIGHVLFDPLLYETADNIGDTKAPDNIEDIKAPADQTSADDDDFLVNEPKIKSSPQPLLVSQSNFKNTVIENMTEHSTILPETLLREASDSFSSTHNPRKVSSKVSKDVLRNDKTNKQDTVANYGYEFDQTICKEINNVIMCGYNKNQGDAKDTGAPVPMQNKDGCVIRNDRIECGYVKGNYVHGASLRSFPDLNINKSDRFDQIVWILRNSANFSSNVDTAFSRSSPADSARVKTKVPISYSESINSESEPVYTTKIKLTTNFDPKSTYTINLNVTNSEFGGHSTSKSSREGSMFLSALTSGKMMLWLTSRAAKITTRETTVRQIPTRTSPREIVSETFSAVTAKRVTSPKLVTTLTTTMVTGPPTTKVPEKVFTTTADKDVLRNKEAIMEDIDGEPSVAPGGCASCVWNTILRKKGLRNLDEISTRKCVTRCVEIGDRIVCYPFKHKTTTPVTP